jgi:copper transport protein
LLLTSAAFVWIATITATTGFAHAALISTSPTDGEVLPSAPAEVILTFNENVRPVEDAMRLFDSTGQETILAAASRNSDVVITLPESLPEGTFLVDWRVISADGHPIGGALTFAVGSETGTPVSSGDDGENTWTNRWLSIVQGVAYVGLLIAAGLVLFQVFVQHETRSTTWLACGAAILGGLSWLLILPLQTARQQGRDPGYIFSPGDWMDQLDRNAVVTSLMVVAGLAVGIGIGFLSRWRWVSVIQVTAAAIALIGPTWSGHTRVFTPEWAIVGSNLVHTLAAAVWLGGLSGLILALRSSDQVTGQAESSTLAQASIIARFSQLAGIVIALLIPTGLLSGWIILGAVKPFYDTTYGRLVLAKIALVAIVLVVAAWNRFRLVPVIAKQDGIPDRMRQTLRNLVSIECTILMVVAMVTGFLVNQSPTEATSTPAGESSQQVTLDLDATIATGTISPLDTGSSVFEFQLTDEQGNPLEPRNIPTIHYSLPSADVGPLTATVEETGSPGTYRATFEFAIPGTWEIMLMVRVSTFQEPMASFTVEIEG